MVIGISARESAVGISDKLPVVVELPNVDLPSRLIGVNGVVGAGEGFSSSDSPVTISPRDMPA